MSYIYCIKININTKDDVNLKFREHNLKGELFATLDGGFYICPQLSYKMWSCYPQVKKIPASICKSWNNAINDCIALLIKEYKEFYFIGKICWQNIQTSLRCSKMESFIREFDIN